MQNNFRELEELVFFDLWIRDSGDRIQVSGFRFPGFRVAQSKLVQYISLLKLQRMPRPPKHTTCGTQDARLFLTSVKYVFLLNETP